jgi:hypothetical protein
MRNDKPSFWARKDLEGWTLIRGGSEQGRFTIASGWTTNLVEEMVEVLNRNMERW